MSKKDVAAVVSGMGVATSIIETLVATIREEGGSDEDIHRLSRPESRSLFAKFAKMVVAVRFPDWVREVVEDAPFHGGGIALAEFFTGSDEEWIRWEEMLVRAKKGLRLGYRDALFHWDHPELLPKEAKGRILVFAGTVLVDELGHRRVPVLHCYGEAPELDWSWLVGAFSQRCCLAVPRA
ncbi:hypothetical protein EPN83_01630 [Patescibacteria group bacterium]|nr:MAG: hypothetical protein EPN83_01630 [Patescibacteria group bacterium]